MPLRIVTTCQAKARRANRFACTLLVVQQFTRILMWVREIAIKSRIREWTEKLRRHQRNIATVSHSLALDIGVPPEAVDRILRQAMVELRDLADEDEAADAWPVINKAINELDKYGYHSRPSEEAIMERYLDELPERDFNILRHFKQGKKHREIAALMGTDAESVRRSLVKTYADLRMKMTNSGGGGDGEPIAPPQSEQPAARTSGSY